MPRRLDRGHLSSTDARLARRARHPLHAVVATSCRLRHARLSFGEQTITHAAFLCLAPVAYRSLGLLPVAREWMLLLRVRRSANGGKEGQESRRTDVADDGPGGGIEQDGGAVKVCTYVLRTDVGLTSRYGGQLISSVLREEDDPCNAFGSHPCHPSGGKESRASDSPVKSSYCTERTQFFRSQTRRRIWCLVSSSHDRLNRTGRF